MIQPGLLQLRDYALLALFALIMLMPGISGLPPMDRDESRYAVASTQMLLSGDYIDIRYQDVPRYLQPAGIYWAQAAAVSVFSSPEAHQIWAYRLPSLLSCILAVLVTGWLGARTFGRNAGIAAALLMGATLLLGYEARTAKTDAALLGAIIVAQAALMQIYLDPDGRKRRALVFWLALGAGALLKGPIILMVSGTTILALLLWDRKAAWLRGLHALWGVPIFLAIALPWYIAIGVISDGDFYARSIGRNFLGKVGAPEQSHAGPIGYYLMLFPLFFWPGSLIAAFAAPYAWRNRVTPAVRFLIAWIVPTWIIFEFVATKLPHYVLPVYPAIACLAGAALFAAPTQLNKWWKIAGGLFAAIWIVMSGVAAALGPAVTLQIEDRLDWFSIALGAIAFVLSCVCLFWILQKRPHRALACACIAGLLIWPNTFGRVLPSLHTAWLSPRIEAAVSRASTCPETTLATSPFQEPSLVFLHGPYRTDLVDAPSMAADALAQDAHCTLALIGAHEQQAFLARAAELGVNAREIDHISGLNYSNGDELELTLYSASAESAAHD